MRNIRRDMTDAEMASALFAAESRVQANEKKRFTNPVEQLLWDLLKSHPFRTSRLLRDLAWVRKQAKKRGLYMEGL